MTAVGFWKDDAQVVREYVEKRWSDEPCGINIKIEKLEDGNHRGKTAGSFVSPVHVREAFSDSQRKPGTDPHEARSVEKIDSEYICTGTASIFCLIQLHTGQTVHFVEETRTAVDWAEKIRYLVDVIAPEAEKITLVMDKMRPKTGGRPQIVYKTFSKQTLI